MKPNTLPQIPWHDLTLGTLIGNGSFGDVYQGTYRGKPVAIKLLQLKNPPPHLAEEFLKEADIMWQCRDLPNILGLQAVCTEPGHYAMVLDYMPKGSLYQFLHDPSLPELPEQTLWQIAIDMASGLAALHKQGIIHRDLKSFNILLDEQGHAKISDFGLAKLRLETSSATSKAVKAVGTIRWRAPELFERRPKLTPAVDIYSYGMMLWELVSRKLPFEDAGDEITVIRWIEKGEKEDIPEHCPRVWKELIQTCWGPPEKRPPADAILALLQSARPKQHQIPPWHFENRPHEKIEGFVLLPASEREVRKVLEYYEHCPVPGFQLGKVEVIYNPVLNRSFALRLEMLQARHGNPAFAPKWSAENDPDWRREVDKQWRQLSGPFRDEDFPEVKLLPLWHGTKHEILDSIFKTGFANLATTDEGFFGKGLYSSYEAEYAHRVCSQGALLVNWVSSYSAYPVVHGDMEKLTGKANYQNYDTHFAPVIPQDPSNPQEVVYFPTHPGQKHRYIEVVVFETAQCIPRYLVTLQPSLPKSPKAIPPVSPKPKALTLEIPKSPVVSPPVHPKCLPLFRQNPLLRVNCGNRVNDTGN